LNIKCTKGYCFEKAVIKKVEGNNIFVECKKHKKYTVKIGDLNEPVRA